MGLLDLLGSTTSRQNSFMCPHCGTHTPHQKLTLSEYVAINDKHDTVGKISAAFLDITQFTRVVNVAGISHWKCANCGLTTIRTSDGTVDTIGEFSK